MKFRQVILKLTPKPKDLIAFVSLMITIIAYVETRIRHIGPDTTVVHISYLTTSDRYRQWIQMWNRGDSAVEYSFTFITEGARAGADASGMLQPGIKKLDLTRDDVVDLSEVVSTRTAAILKVHAPPAQIGVSTILVNSETGDTHTVDYQ